MYQNCHKDFNHEMATQPELRIFSLPNHIQSTPERHVCCHRSVSVHGPLCNASLARGVQLQAVPYSSRYSAITTHFHNLKGTFTIRAPEERSLTWTTVNVQHHTELIKPSTRCKVTATKEIFAIDSCNVSSVCCCPQSERIC